MINSIAELMPEDATVSEIASEYIDQIRGIIRTRLEADRSARLLDSHVATDELAFYLFSIIQGLKVMAKAGTARATLYTVRDITLRTVL